MNIDAKMDTLENKRTDEIDILIDDEKTEQKKSSQSSEKLSVESVELMDSLQRLQADFSNYRRRSEKEKEELAEFVRGNIVLEILPIIDDFERLLRSKSENIDIKKGAHLIYKNLMSTLEKLGLVAFLDKGEEFDPNFHEALSVKSTSLENDGKIIEIWQKGYRLKKRLLRPAKVVVGEYKTVQENSESNE